MDGTWHLLKHSQIRLEFDWINTIKDVFQVKQQLIYEYLVTSDLHIYSNINSKRTCIKVK